MPVNRTDWRFIFIFYDRDRRSKGRIIPGKRSAAVSVRDNDISFYVYQIERSAEYLSAIPARNHAVHTYVLSYVLVGPELFIVDVAIVSAVVYEVPHCERRCQEPLDVVTQRIPPILQINSHHSFSYNVALSRSNHSSKIAASNNRS